MFDAKNYASAEHEKFSERTHWRVVYEDGKFIEEIKNQDQYSKIDRTRATAFLIIDDETGTELLNVAIPDEFDFAYRTRKIATDNGINVIKLIVLHKKLNSSVKINEIKNQQTGMVSKSWNGRDFYQKFFMLFPDRTIDQFDDPDEDRIYSRIHNIRPDEVS
jgi:hypothetical protein